MKYDNAKEVVLIEIMTVGSKRLMTLPSHVASVNVVPSEK